MQCVMTEMPAEANQSLAEARHISELFRELRTEPKEPCCSPQKHRHQGCVLTVSDAIPLWQDFKASAMQESAELQLSSCRPVRHCSAWENSFRLFSQKQKCSEATWVSRLWYSSLAMSWLPCDDKNVSQRGCERRLGISTKLTQIRKQEHLQNYYQLQNKNTEFFSNYLIVAIIIIHKSTSAYFIGIPACKKV